MSISIFEVVGPVMIGPSSSHTAGAVRLARIARKIISKPFTHVLFELHGSFAKTYVGHGTNLALVAGILDIMEDDEIISSSFSIAKDKNITYKFSETVLEGVHENTVKMTFFNNTEKYGVIIGSSIGGGQILISKINDFKVEFTAQSSALLIQQQDKPGVISKVSHALAKYNINIGTMKVSRQEKGGTAFCVIETDSKLEDSLVSEISAINEIIDVCAINI